MFETSIPADWIAQSAVVLYVLRGSPAQLETAFVSANVERLTGFTVAEAAAANWWREHLHPEDRPRLVAHTDRLEHGLGLTEDYRFRHRDDSYLWVRDQWRVWITNDVVEVIGTWTDITSEKRHTAERQRLAAALDQAGEAIVITDPAGVIRYANPAFESVTGYSQSEVVGKYPSILRSGAHNEQFYRELWATISAGETWRGRLVNRRKDGTLFTEEAAISPVFDDHGTIVDYVAVKRDVTAQLRLAESYRQAQKMEAVGILAGGVAHDFNNMLSVILGNTDLALAETTTGTPEHERLCEIQEAALRSALLTRQLLAFARKQPVAPKVLDLNETIESMLKMLRRLIGEDIELRWFPGSHLPRVLIDPGQVDQLLANLCVNARDAINGVGVLTIVTVNTLLDEHFTAEHPGSEPGEHVQIRVSDTGSGMDADTLEHIFEPFFTTKKSGHGTGLGLATAYGIVKQNRGFIAAESQVGAGSTFSIYLPSHDGPADGDAVGATPARRAQGETILLVEDEAAMLKVTGVLLERQGYRVLRAATPEQAIALATSHPGPIHLLLTDVIMPDMNGADLAQQVGAHRPQIAVIFMSGYPHNVIADRGITDSTHFLQKPFSARDLGSKLQEVLGTG